MPSRHPMTAKENPPQPGLSGFRGSSRGRATYRGCAADSIAGSAGQKRAQVMQPPRSALPLDLSSGWRGSVPIPRVETSVRPRVGSAKVQPVEQPV